MKKKFLIIISFILLSVLYVQYSYSKKLNVLYNKKNDISNIKQLSFNSYEKYKKEDLLKLSLNIESIYEKIYIRYYLSKKYPNSPEGIFSKGWLADYDNKPILRDEYYEDCMKKYPFFIPSLYNYLKTYNPKENSKEIIKKLDKALNLNPSHNNYSLIGMGYYFYKYNLNNQDYANEFLEKWSKKLGANLYIFDYINGLELKNTGQIDLSEQYFINALNKKEGRENFELWREFINLTTNKDFNEKFSNKKLKNLNPLIEYIKHKSVDKNKTLDSKIFMLNSYQLIADKFKEFDKFESSYNYYKKAFDILPTTDVA